MCLLSSRVQFHQYNLPLSLRINRLVSRRPFRQRPHRLSPLLSQPACQVRCQVVRRPRSRPLNRQYSPAQCPALRRLLCPAISPRHGYRAPSPLRCQVVNQLTHPVANHLHRRRLSRCPVLAPFRVHDHQVSRLQFHRTIRRPTPARSHQPYQVRSPARRLRNCTMHRLSCCLQLRRTSRAS